MKHPVAVAFAVAVAISLVLVGVVFAIYSRQQAPWALALVVLAFPFVWFFAWLITNAVSWGRETMSEDKSGERDGRGSDHK